MASCLIAAAILAAMATPAYALWSTPAAQRTQTVSSGTLIAPASASAVNGTCTPRTTWRVNLSWGQSPSLIADGYEILRSTTAGSGYTVVGTVTGRTTTTFVDQTPAAATTYFYVVRTKRNLWRSINSPEASVTTLKTNCN